MAAKRLGKQGEAKRIGKGNGGTTEKRSRLVPTILKLYLLEECPKNCF
jgi:hypothetical protein